MQPNSTHPAQPPLPPLIVRSGQGRAYELGPAIAGYRLFGASDTDGAFSLFELTVAPGGGVPFHAHLREDEGYLVLDGRFEFVIDGESFERTSGTALFGPCGVVHGFTNVGETAGRLLLLVTPAGFEKFLAELEEIGGFADPAALADVYERHGVVGADSEPSRPRTTGSTLPTPPGRWMEMGDHRARVLLRDTMLVADAEVDPAGGVPPHVHRNEDETFFIVRGRFSFLLGSRSFEAGPGDCVFAPRHVAHAFRCIGDAPGRMFVVVTSPAFEGFLAGLETILGEKGGPVAMDDIAALFAEFGIESATPPTTMQDSLRRPF